MSRIFILNHKIKLMLFISLITLWVQITPAQAAVEDVELSLYSKATYLVSQGKYKQASEQWHQLTIIILSSEAKLGRKKMWQYAGLSEALAAISADKNNNAEAYQYWADSTRYLMTGGINWEKMRKNLHRRYERSNTQLSSQLQINDLSAGIDEKWQQELTTLQVWDDKLSIFSFNAPKLGLQENVRKQVQPASAVMPQAIYQPPSATGKKLSGIKTQFNNEQNFRPISAGMNNDKVVSNDASKNSTVVVDKNVSVNDGSGDNIEVSESVNKGKDNVTVDQVVSGNISTSNKKLNVVLSPVEEIKFKENEVTQINKEIIDNSEGDVDNPLAKGNLATIEETNVKALRRRSFAPVSSTSE
ncbi:MAG: hypothetical protein V7735_10210 [Photobacterium frigidiphilum]|uniref:hypothetical protein n=1 Tax=Photobacterium frigidiphilum TaxID=264736 RepID=UPI00300248B5